MVNRTIRRVVTALALSIFIATNLAASATAAKSNINSALGLQISPVIVNVNADKGKTYYFKISALNVTSADLYVTPHVNDFRSKDETGTPQVILDDSTSPTSAKQWIKLDVPSEFKLASKKSKTVNIVMTVPKDAEPGGHYATVRFTANGQPLKNSSGVSLEASWGTLVLVRVSGNIKEQLFMESFYTSKGEKRSGLFEKSPVVFTERIHNTGNVHVAPTGKLTIKNMFGKKVDELDVNKDGGNVLPRSIRRFSQTSKKSMFGRYTASVTLAYGTHGQVLISSTSFWVIPWKLILISLVIIGLGIFLLVKAYQANNKRVIKKALNKNKE